MAIIIDTADLEDDKLSSAHNYWVYNGLDCCVTHEVHQALIPQLDEHTKTVYDMERKLQAPAMDMMLRGIKIDRVIRTRELKRLKEVQVRLQAILDRYAEAVWDAPLNIDSPAQMQKFFYGAMKIPEIKVQKKGIWKVSTDREALEKMMGYFYCQPIVNCILALRDVGKKISTLETEIDWDGRIRTSYNVAGTETGRWSSSSNAFGTGGNLQNITGSLRQVFCADPGYKMAYIDLEQAESRLVGLLAWLCTGRSGYLDACESGDLHSLVCKLVWPDLAWTGNLAHDKKNVAEQPFYRDYSYRDMAKRGGHGCLTDGHEVLTPGGWLDISKVPNGMPIMAWDWKTGKTYWDIPSHWERKPWHGTLHHYKGQAYDMVVTSDHRMPCQNGMGKKIELPGEEAWKKGEYRLPLTGEFQGGSAQVTVNQAQLHSAFQADGFLEKGGAVRFTFSKERKMNRLVQLLGDRPFTIWKMQRGERTIRVPNPDFVFGGKKAGMYLMDWPKEALKAYTTEHLWWDGTDQENFAWVYGKDREHIWWLFFIARICGQGSQYCANEGFDCARMSYNSRHAARIGSMKIAHLESAGTLVYCPTVRGGGFVVRRNDKVMFSLNTNYYGKARTIARNLKIEEFVATMFQSKYFKAFPEIGQWHEWTANELRTKGYLITPVGRKRHFFDRLWDDATLRKAIAFVPQSTIADMLNEGMYRVWERVPEAQLLAQIHDAIIVQYPEDQEDIIVPKVLEALNVVLEIQGPDGTVRKFSIPSEAQTGWNWAKYTSADDVKAAAAKGKILDFNPNGIKKYKPGDTRKRVESNVLDAYAA